jgi:hypothetical protein
MDLVSTTIRSAITALDSFKEVDEDESKEDINRPAEEPRVFHGSIRPRITLAQVGIDHANDAAFGQFRVKLSKALSSQVGTRIVLRPNDVVRSS